MINNMNKKSELLVITETKRLIDYIFTITEKSPKKFRYSLLTKMHNLLLDIIELLYEANNLLITDKNRLSKQETAKVKFKLLDYICDLSAREKSFCLVNTKI